MSAFERNGANILNAVIVALLIWVGWSTVQLRESVVRLQTQMTDVVVKRMDRQDTTIFDHERRIRALEH